MFEYRFEEACLRFGAMGETGERLTAWKGDRLVKDYGPSSLNDLTKLGVVLDHVAGRGPLPCPGEAALKHVEAMEALRQSDMAESGAQFIGDLAPAAKGGELLCKRALDAIDEHYADADLSLVSLSGMLDVSPNHLSACIKKHAGETFINILIGKRMEAARELIASSPLKIQQIAQQCGYTDQHYFSYCFKKYCGESPNAMRRRLDAQRAEAAR